MKISYKNITPKKKYKYIVCMAYYFGEPTDISKKSGKNRKVENKKEVALNTLKFLANDKAIDNALFFILDDASPNKLTQKEIFDQIKNRPTFHLTLKNNVGCAEKENIFNAIAIEFGDYIIRVDDDVTFENSLDHALKGLKKIKDIGVITINCDVLAYYAFRDNDKEYVDSKMIGNVWISPVEVFKKIGMTDPTLGYFHDRDLIYKMVYEGYRCIVSRKSKGIHQRSGAGISVEQRRKDAKYFAKRCPLVKISYNKKGNPICRYIPLNKKGFFDNEYIKIGACKKAKTIIKKINDIFSKKCGD